LCALRARVCGIAVLSRRAARQNSVRRLGGELALVSAARSYVVPAQGGLRAQLVVRDMADLLHAELRAARRLHFPCVGHCSGAGGLMHFENPFGLAELIELGGSAAVVLLMIGVAAMLGFRMSARIDDGELTRLAETEGVRVDGAVIAKNGRTALA